MFLGICTKVPHGLPSLCIHRLGETFPCFISNQGLGHTISPDAPRIDVISCADYIYLFGHFGEALVTEHSRTWGYICEATADAPFGIVFTSVTPFRMLCGQCESGRCPSNQPSGICLRWNWRVSSSWGMKTPNFSLSAFLVSRLRCVP